MAQRPEFSDIQSSEEFKRWYWLKEELVEICKLAKLPYHGKKFDLRDRIIYAMDNNGALLPSAKKPKKQSTFNWARAELTLSTVITDDVSFGPNFRRFMSQQIATKFVCHSDFMDWVKANPGKTLQDAVLAWEQLEKRKDDPTFKRTIAAQNMLARYVREFLDDNPGKVFNDALACWKRKKAQPVEDGVVSYHPTDLSLA